MSPFWDQDDKALKEVSAQLTGQPKSSRRHSAATVPGYDGAFPLPPYLAGRVDTYRLKQTDNEVRPLHAKCLLLSSDTWIAALVGSSNHTQAGLGLTGRPHRELNVWLGAPLKSKEGKALSKLISAGERISVADQEPVFTDEDEQPQLSLPLFFEFCQLRKSDLGDGWQVELHLDPTAPIEIWTVASTSGVELLSAEQWRAAGGPKSINRDLPSGEVPSFITVAWSEGALSWTVLVDDPHLLPSGPSVADLTARQLFSALAAGKSITAAAEDHLRNTLDAESTGTGKWYIRTGEALEDALEVKIEDAISSIAATALGIPADQALSSVTQISDRLFRTPGRSGEEFRDRLREHLASSVSSLSGDSTALIDDLIEATVRTLRSPAYLARYTWLSADMDIEALWRGLRGDNPGGLNFLKRLEEFARRAAAMEKSERVSVFTALLGDHQDATSGGRGAQLRQVRRAHGATKRSTRERLTRVFNTPFAPDILVASSVLGEGIDLHQECRDVIHHDLDWNPSVLEQRTGRLDRIGSLAERCEEKIDVYEPYLAGTHDEKMFRVVKDRAGWFEIVMGRASGHSEVDTDKEEDRVPLAPKIAKALTMDLRSPVS